MFQIQHVGTVVRPYAGTPAPAERRPAPVLRLANDGIGDDRALPPWLARMRTELAPREQRETPPRPSPEERGPVPRSITRPAPVAKKRKRSIIRGPLDESARRWESARHACTVLGMLLAAYAIGLSG
ncbi:hypothetical protein [Nocardiopsis halophila]|uniref:hypothetical protein n=1 Tax=Nocardiopsis halophila TaxID=141692 RepID=UPI001F4CDE7D|nr:hypothetical protein [Nocardiopsis halophila]